MGQRERAGLVLPDAALFISDSPQNDFSVSFYPAMAVTLWQDGFGGLMFRIMMGGSLIQCDNAKDVMALIRTVEKTIAVPHRPKRPRQRKSKQNNP